MIAVVSLGYGHQFRNLFRALFYFWEDPWSKSKYCGLELSGDSMFIIVPPEISVAIRWLLTVSVEPAMLATTRI